MEQMTTDSAVLAKEGANFERIADELKTVIAQVQSTAAELTGEANWKGSAADAVRAAFQRFNDAATVQVNQLNAIANNVATAGVQYGNTDGEQSGTLAAAMRLDGHAATSGGTIKAVDYTTGDGQKVPSPPQKPPQVITMPGAPGQGFSKCDTGEVLKRESEVVVGGLTAAGSLGGGPLAAIAGIGAGGWMIEDGIDALEKCK